MPPQEDVVGADTLLIVEDSFVQAKTIRKQFQALTELILLMESIAQEILK